MFTPFLKVVPFIFILGMLLLSSACTSTGLTREQEHNRDYWIGEAESQYDDADTNPAAYTYAYRYAGNALAIDPENMRARLVQAWSLLQTGYFDDFSLPQSGARNRGARNLFLAVLAESPNEFWARLGLGTLQFREHFIFERAAKVFGKNATDAESLARRARNLATAPDDFELVRLREDVSGFRRGLIELRKKTPTLFVAPDGSGREIGNTVEDGELLALDVLEHDLRKGMLADAAATLDELMQAATARKQFWQDTALARVESAREFFTGIERSAPTYFQIHRDLAFVEIALGGRALALGMQRAEADARAKLDWDKVPQAERAEVLRDFYLDERVHANPERDKARMHFENAAAQLERFIRESQRFEVSEEARGAQAREALADGEKSNAVIQDIADLYSRELANLLATHRNYRKLMLLQLLELLMYPEYGIQDLEKATLWVNELYLTDFDDPIYFFIRGTIYDKLGKYQQAIHEYDTYLARSSITTDYDRQRRVEDRIRICTQRAGQPAK